MAHTFLITIGASASNIPYISFITELDFAQERDRERVRQFQNQAQKEKIQSISVYPNPFSSNLTLRVESSNSESISCRVLDALGRLVVNQELKTSSGVDEYILPLLQHPPGIYMIQVYNEAGVTWAMKVIKK